MCSIFASRGTQRHHTYHMVLIYPENIASKMEDTVGCITGIFVNLIIKFFRKQDNSSHSFKIWHTCNRTFSVSYVLVLSLPACAQNNHVPIAV